MKKFHFLENWGDNTWYGSNKWYDWDYDMIILSRKFPEKLFTIRGDGENSGDVWGYYYKNGDSYTQREVIEYPVSKYPELSTTPIAKSKSEGDEKYSFERRG